MAAEGKQTLCVPGDEAGPDPKLWLFCHRKEQEEMSSLVCYHCNVKQCWDCTLCPWHT